MSNDNTPERETHPSRARTRTMATIGAMWLALLFVLLAVGLIPRIRNMRALAAAADQTRNTVSTVYVVHPQRSTDEGLTLAATTQANPDTVLYARTNGYLKRRYVDIGDRVREGEPLAEIESPEIDAQLRQAQANLQQSQKTLDLQIANRDLAKVTMDRYLAAKAEQAVALELVDQSVAAYRTAQASVDAAEATVAASRATVQQYLDLTSFERVLAPFDGMILQRNVDVGALITAGSPVNNIAVAPSNLAGTPTGLFEIGQVDKLRVFVNVPQAFAPNVRTGLSVSIHARGHLDHPVGASVTRTASSLDPSTRTLLTQVDIPNPSGRLMPGMFVYVDFNITPAGIRWRLPATALIFDAQGTRVVTIAPGNKIHFQQVQVGRDFGDTIDIQGGLSGHETIVAQPTVSLKEGQVVTPMAATATQ